MVETSLLEFALQLAGRGWRVFPLHSVDTAGNCTCGRPKCESVAKHPRTRGGFKAASSDPAQVEAWWKKWPQANIGLATGSGLVVVDVDGPEGLAELQGFLNGRTLPRTLTAQTGRGLHFYYAALAGSVRSSARGKVHVRGEGGYVVAPPSRHASGRQYQWIESVPIAELPDFLKIWLQDTGITKVTASGTGDQASGGNAALAIPEHIIKRKQRLAAVGSTNLAAKSLKTFVPEWDSAEESRVRSALKAIPANCDRDTWLHIGMALHSLGWEVGGTAGESSDRGYDLWLDWSRTGGDKFQGEFDCETRWRSFGRRGGVSIGTLFHKASECGWDGQVVPKPASGGAPGNAPEAVGAVHRANGHAVALPKGFNIVWPDTDKAGKPKPTAVNVRKAAQSLGLDCRYDAFHERLWVGGQMLHQWAGELSDNLEQHFRVMVHRECGFDPGAIATHDGLVQECLQHTFDPVCNYLNELKWDGVPRLDRWLHTYLGAEDSRLNAMIGRLSLVAAVRRAMVPGTKFDQIVVFESAEGQGKSTAIEILAGADNFSDQPILTLDDRGQQEAVQGVWIYEIADLAGMARAEVERVKAFASRRVDRARPAYGRSRIDKPRRCVFFATTNDETYLKSQTGNRRFWPVVVGRADLAALKRDRDQLWAEAVEAEQGAPTIFLPEALWGDAREEQEKRREVDPWELILESIEGKIPPHAPQERRISARDLLDMVLRLPVGQQTRGNQCRASQIMQKLGWQRCKIKEGHRLYNWPCLTLRRNARNRPKGFETRGFSPGNCGKSRHGARLWRGYSSYIKLSLCKC